MNPHRRRTWKLLQLGLAAACLLTVACEQKAPPPSGKPTAPAPNAPAPNAPAPAPPAKPPTPPVEEIPIAVEGFRSDAALIKALRQGGYVIALRHARTNMEQKDEQGTNFDDCAKQRQLNEQGRADAKQIGEWFKQIGIPVGEVISSPFCRNKETAQLAFGRFTIDTAVMGQDGESVAKRQKLLSTPPAPGQNTVVVSHQKEMTKSTGLEMELFGEGGALVMTPTGGPGGGFQIVRFVRFDDWAELAKQAGEVK